MAEAMLVVDVESKAWGRLVERQEAPRPPFSSALLGRAEGPRTLALPSSSTLICPMFYYIFFLRPPPTHAAPGSLITFTPKVANDLRTEDFPSAEELFYSWAPADARQGTQATESYPQISAPQKLTVWRPGNFKEVSVPLPPRAREGQAFRLVLTTRAHARAHIANLAASPATAKGCDKVGARPFPVMSMPIVISARARAEKQQEIERVYRIPLLPGRDGFLKVKEQTSFDLDKVCVTSVVQRSWMADFVGSEVENLG